MDITPIAIAVVIAAVQIFTNGVDRERLEKDHPEISLRDYAPSNLLMYILIIAELALLVTGLIRGNA